MRMARKNLEIEFGNPNQMDRDCRIRRPDSDWYSPTRLRTDSVAYDFPGDRFIPSRSLMDLDHARTLLTSPTKEPGSPKYSVEYRQKLEDSINLDSAGRQFRLLVFRGSPKGSTRKSLAHIEDMRRNDDPALNSPFKQYRKYPHKEATALDAPNFRDDYYANLMDWGKNNVLAVGLGTDVYLWNAETKTAQMLLKVDYHLDNYPTSIAWSRDAKMLAVGFLSPEIELWDPVNLKLVRTLEGHHRRVNCLAWNGNTLTSGSDDTTIINHDFRVRNSIVSRWTSHRDRICGLKWSRTGNMLASGGNDDVIYIWDASKISSSHFLHKFNEHNGAVKALSWCPYDFSTLASGGGTMDGCIRIWDTNKGLCTNTVNVQSQICGLEWNTHHKELLSGHGFISQQFQNQLCLWKYPAMSKITAFKCPYMSRVLQLSQSPDGLTVVSAGADQTLRLWKIFGPPHPQNSPRLSELESMLSLKTSPIR